MNRWTIKHLDGGYPSDYLAAIGIVCLVPGATMAFPAGTAPVLASELDENNVAAQIVEGIERLTLEDTSPLPDAKPMYTTTPAWSSLAELCLQSWDNPTVDRLLRTFDTGSVKERGKLDPQVESAALVLVSGRSYVRKSIGELWPARDKKADRDQQLQAARDAFHNDALDLLQGRRPQSVADAMALRFTASETSPRLRAGTDASVITPLVEGLAFAGATCLLPRQEGISVDNPQARTKGLKWALNPVPLTVQAIVDVHEQDAAPSQWPSFTAEVRTIGGGTMAQHFVYVRALEQR